MDSQPQLPAYLVEAVLRFSAESRSSVEQELNALRAHLAQLAGLSGQAESRVAPPSPEPDHGPEPRPTFAYGAIGRAVRQIMRDAPRQGLLIGDIVTRAQHDMNLDISARMAREALKRLKKSGDVECRNRQRWVATDKFRSANDANGNGALNGNPASAPIAGEGWPLHQSRQPQLLG